MAETPIRNSGLPNSVPEVDTRRDGATCQEPDPIGILREEHALQNELCDLLEAIADGLPHQFDRSLAHVSLSILETGMPSHMRLEEEALFPLLRQRVPEGHSLHSAMQCLEHEHDRDGAAMVEIAEALRSAVESGHVGNPEMLGYMLRGFFDSQRRHIAWEEAVVLPTARDVLTDADLRHIQSWIMRSDHPRCSRKSIMALREARHSATLGAGLCATCDSSAKKPMSGLKN